MAVTEGIKFLYQFSLGEYDITNPGDNVISVTSTAAGDHDKKNLTTTILRETWRSSGVGLQEIVIQANDTSEAIDTFAILNHNFTDLATVTLQANTVNNFSSPPVSLTIPWNEKHMVLLQDLGTAYSYFKISILDPTNPCGYIEIGRIIGGTSFTFTQNEDITDDFSLQTEDLAYKMKSEGFFRASNERVKIDKLGIKFDKLQTRSPDNDNYLGLKAFTNFVGETLPFLTILDPEDPYFSVIWGQLNQMPMINYTVNRYSTMSLAIEEVF